MDDHLGASTGSDGADSDASSSKLSPLSSSSPRAPSPRPASCPIAVPGSCGGADGDEQPAGEPAGGAAAALAGGSGRSSSNGGRMPALSPPEPELSPEELGKLMEKASPVISDGRFSMSEFLKNKAAMTTAARRELVGGGGGDGASHGGLPQDDDVASALEDAGHAADLARQAAHIASLTHAVAEESKVNRELAALLVERLDASRRAVECLMRLLTCLMEAEAAYSAAMSSAAKTASTGPLAAPSDSTGLVAALDGMVALPAAAAAGHRQLYLELQMLVERVRGLWRRYTATAKELKQAVQTVHRGIDGCCKQLAASFAEHKSACDAFDAAVVWHSSSNCSSPVQRSRHQQKPQQPQLQQLQQQGGGQWHRRVASADAGERQQRASWGGAAAAAAAGVAALRPRFVAAPARDPWASEGKLVSEQEALKRWQDQERELLQKGFETLQVLETERISDLLSAGQTLAASYPAAVEALPPAAEGLRSRLGGLGGAGEAGLAHLAQVAADMRATSEALALRQSDALASVAQELFCSPEIIRQGQMELWNSRSSSWASHHFVLTRAGFLHWFRGLDDSQPLEPPLNLSRCEFEAGQAPAFHLVEAGTGSWLVGRGSRKVTLKAASVDECCEWAIALRESIALSTGSSSVARTASGLR